MRARALFFSSSAATVAAAVAIAIGLCAVACEPTPGTPLPADADGQYAWMDASDWDGPVYDAGPRDTAPQDLGIYDAPLVEDGNCVVFQPDGAPIAAECLPGTTCDVSGVAPLCARGEEAGVTCGSIGCIGAGGCGTGNVCASAYDF